MGRYFADTFRSSSSIGTTRITSFQSGSPSKISRSSASQLLASGRDRASPGVASGVWPVRVVVVDEDAEHALKVRPIHDQAAVQAL